jgi:beta-lactamase superfamily II metal-dependent hydrolase
VGQGDAVVVQGRRGALLVDGGAALADGVDLGRSVVVPALVALGVQRPRGLAPPARRDERWSCHGETAR